MHKFMHKGLKLYLCAKILRKLYSNGEKMAKTTLYLLRHGQSVGNLGSKMLGHTDLELTELGRLQARKTAEALQDVDFCAIYSSDLSRAFDTAQTNALLHNLDVKINKNLRELYFGDWENVSVEIAKRDFPELFIGGWREQFGTFRCPNGESTQEAAQRIYDALIDIANAHVGGTVLVTFHAAAIRAVWGKILGLPAEKWATETWFPTNASYSVVEFDGDKFSPISFSNDAHLGEFITQIKP